MAKKKNKPAKKPYSSKGSANKHQKKEAPQPKIADFKEHYLWNMHDAPMPGQDTSVFQLLPAAFFTAFTIIIVRLHSYTRDMSEFYWSAGNNNLSDFFSYYKGIAIIVCVILAFVFLLYRLFVQNFYIKRSILYIPSLVYIAFVLLSFAFSSQKTIAWEGWNDRFEGTLILMCYIFMMFYIINLVNSERGVKVIVYALAGSSFLLSILGLSQALDRDFFRSEIGQKLIVPNGPLESGKTTWESISEFAARGEQFLEFTFQNREIYQTVYNINYVSFYLTLLIPIFGLLFIQEKKIIKKIIWGVLFGLLVFNLIGSASSGGLLGMFVIVVVGVIVFNKKIITWWKPFAILIVIVLIVGGVTFERWSPELTGAIKGVVGTSENVSTPADGVDSESPAEEADPSLPGASGHIIDYFANKGDTIELSLDGNVAVIDLSKSDSIIVTDEDDKQLSISQDPSSAIISINDERFAPLAMQPTTDENGNSLLVLSLTGESRTWPFTRTDDGVMLVNDLGNTVKLEKVPTFGFENNLGFGSGRGYIWSRSLPMIKDTLFIGNGADTYCAYFPHRDYIGKYNAGWNINMVVDKPHNMYIGVAINTGLLSLIALLTLFGIYLVQSVKIYFRNKMDSYIAFVGGGIFLGICGFLVSGIVNDSSVSVMPMFYGLLGTGIAINMLLKKNVE